MFTGELYMHYGKTLHINIEYKIKEQRLMNNLTREKLAKNMIPPISSKYLWEIEAGKKNMTADVLRRLAIALNVSSDFLLDLSINNDNND